MTDFIPGEGYRLDVIAADDSVIVDSWAGQLKASVVSIDGSIQVDVESGKIYGPMIGNIEDIHGNVMYDADLNDFKTNIIGDVKDTLGNTVVDSDLGIVTAVLRGDVVSDDGDIIVNADTKVIEAETIYGTFHGDLFGSVTSDSIISGAFSGDFNGTSYGEFFGEFTGDATGNFTGDLTGNVVGNVTGNLIGTVMADDSTALTAPPNEQYNQWNWLGGIDHPVLPDESSVARGPIIELGESRSDSSVRSHIQHYDGTPVVMLDILGGSPWKAQFRGKLRGAVHDTEDNPILYTDIEGVTLTSENGIIVVGKAGNTEEIDLRADQIILRSPIDNNRTMGVSYTARGTMNSPLAVRPHDYVYSFNACGYNGSNYVPSGAYTFIADPDIDVDPNSNGIASGFIVTLSNGIDTHKENLNRLEYKHDGSLKVKTFHASGTTFSERDSMAPKEGMIIFNKNSKKFQGFTGDEWVDLH